MENQNNNTEGNAFTLKNVCIVSNIVFSILIILGDILYITFGTLLLKSTASALFVLMGLLNLIFLKYNDLKVNKFSLFLFFGLVFAMLGDIILNLHFISGAALFAIGHIFFLISYMHLNKFGWHDILFGAVIFVPSVLFITLAPIFDFGGVLMEVVCVVYAIIISLMVGKALSNCIKLKSRLSIIILLGSMLFFISDLMLLLNVFAGLPKVIDILCLATYYPAEILLALSIFLSTTNKSSQTESN